MREIKAVILDFDDTLCLTEEACFGLENYTLEQMDRQPMSREVHLQTWGKPLFDAMPLRSPGLDLDEFKRHYEPAIKKWTEEGKLDAVPEKNIQALQRLIAMAKSLVVLTSRTELELEHVLDPSHQLNGYVETYYHKDNMKYHKPDPRAFAHIEEEHGWKPVECVYVGDSVTDASSAKQAGLIFIASLESGLRTKQDFSRQNVDAFINDFTELPDAIASLENI